MRPRSTPILSRWPIYRPRCAMRVSGSTMPSRWSSPTGRLPRSRARRNSGAAHWRSANRLRLSRGAAQIEPLDDVVALQFVDRRRRDDDFAVDDDVAAAGNPDRLVEVLFSHENGQTKI